MSPSAPLPERLETERLLQRPLSFEDEPFLHALHTDPAVVRYLGDGSTRTSEETRSFLQKTMRWNAEEGVGVYAVTTHEGELVGRCGFNLFEVEQETTPGEPPIATWGPGSAADTTRVRRVLEVGYTFHPDAWGRGFATEAARAWMDFAFDVRGETFISSFIHAENIASIRVAEKNGLVATGTSIRMSGLVYDWYRREGPRSS